MKPVTIHLFCDYFVEAGDKSITYDHFPCKNSVVEIYETEKPLAMSSIKYYLGHPDHFHITVNRVTPYKAFNIGHRGDILCLKVNASIDNYNNYSETQLENVIQNTCRHYGKSEADSASKCHQYFYLPMIIDFE